MPAPTDATTTRPTAVVTGASGGIGFEFSKLLARDGHDLLLVARDRARLDQVAEEIRNASAVSVHVLPADLAAPSAPDAVFAALRDAGLAVDVLVNNAGFASYGPFAETDLAHELSLIRVNVEALTHLTKLALPGMIERRSGKILNVASTAAFLPGPLMAVYYASKAYVLSFSEALAEELRGSGVTVTALCPGPTATGFQRRAGMEASKIVSGRRLPGAADVAAAGYRGLTRGDRIVIPGLNNRLTILAPRALPRALLTRLVRRAQERTAH